MTHSDQLRQALDQYDERGAYQIDSHQTDHLAVAARCWLRLQEGDEQLVEKVAAVLKDAFYETSNERDYACAVLAAITEEEQK